MAVTAVTALQRGGAVDSWWPAARLRAGTPAVAVGVPAFASPWAREEGVCRDSTLLIALCFQAEALQDLTFLGIHFGRQSRRASRDLTLFGVHMTPAERRPRGQR